jgi:hypothetical protein
MLGLKECDTILGVLPLKSNCLDERIFPSNKRQPWFMLITKEVLPRQGLVSIEYYFPALGAIVDFVSHNSQLR